MVARLQATRDCLTWVLGFKDEDDPQLKLAVERALDSSTKSLQLSIPTDQKCQHKFDARAICEKCGKDVLQIEDEKCGKSRNQIEDEPKS